MKKILSLTVLGMMTVGTANAGMAVNVLGGMNYNKNSESPATAGQTTSAKGALSYGASFEFGVVPMFGVEVGVLSVGKSNKIDTGATGSAVSTIRAIQIPVMLRFTALPILDFGIGGYYGSSAKKYKISESTIAGVPDGSYDVDSAAYESSDFGARASLRAKFPVAPMIGILLDVNYSMGLKDLDKSSATTEKTREFALLAGASFGF